MTQFIQSSILNEIQPFAYHLTMCYSKNGITDITDEYERFVKSYTTCKFILNAPIGSGKSTALMNHIKENTNKSYIIVVPTVNIAFDFAEKFDSPETIKLCVDNGAFNNLKAAIDEKTRIIITTYYTCSHYLGSIIEYVDDSLFDKYYLIIDEAHLLLQHPELIEMTREFNNVGLITATPHDFKHLRVFKDFRMITPKINTHYKWKLIIHRLNHQHNVAVINNQYAEIIELLKKNIDKYNVIIIKIEDKLEGKIIKQMLITDGIRSLLYNEDRKETELLHGKFIDLKNKQPLINAVVICTSTIQAGQSFTDDVLSILIQTHTDNIASVEQFNGRNRCDESITHLFLSIDRPLIKATNDDSKDRYYNRFIESRLKVWAQMNIQKWTKRLEKLGEVILTDELINASHFFNVSLNKSCEQNNTIDNPQSGCRSNDSGIKDFLELAHNGSNTLDTRTMTGKYTTNLFNETQFNGKVLNIRFEPYDKEAALVEYFANPYSDTNEDSIEHKINKKPIYAYYYNNIRSLNQIYNCLQRVYEIEN